MSELLNQSALLAGVDLDKDHFVHGRSHNPNVAVLVSMVPHIKRCLHLQLQTHSRHVLLRPLLLGSQIKVHDLSEVFVLDYQMPGWIVGCVSRLLDFQHILHQLHVNFSIVLHQIGLLPTPHLQLMSSLTDNAPLSSVGIWLVEVGEAVFPCGGFIELIGLVGEGCGWRLLEDLVICGEVVGSSCEKQ